MKRNLENKMIFGVCSGLAESLNMDVSLIRLIFCILTLLGFGLPVLVYIVLACVLPTK